LSGRLTDILVNNDNDVSLLLYYFTNISTRYRISRTNYTVHKKQSTGTVLFNGLLDSCVTTKGVGGASSRGGECVATKAGAFSTEGKGDTAVVLPLPARNTFKHCNQTITPINTNTTPKPNKNSKLVKQ
jgi:hypothetical protein